MFPISHLRLQKGNDRHKPTEYERPSLAIAKRKASTGVPLGTPAGSLRFLIVYLSLSPSATCQTAQAASRQGSSTTALPITQVMISPTIKNTAITLSASSYNACLL